MKSSLSKDKDVLKFTNVENSSGRYIRFGKEKTIVRFLSDNFVGDFVHVLKTDEKSIFKVFACLGGVEGKGYSPDSCPICAEGKKHWDRRKEIMADPKFKKSVNLKAHAEVEKEKGKMFQTQKTAVMIGVQGELKKVKGKSKIVFEDNAKYLQMSKAQWKKLTEEIFENEDYKEFMKSFDDLLNRNLAFIKMKKKGDRGQFTEVTIQPSKKKSPTPDIDISDLDLDTVITTVTKSEAKEILHEYLQKVGDDTDEDLEDGEDSREEVSDEDEPEEKPKKRKTRKKKEEPEEEPDKEEEEPDLNDDDDDDDDEPSEEDDDF